MKSKKTLSALIFFTIILSTKVLCQNFKVSPLIEMPGDNMELDVLSPEIGSPNSETYMCWVNKLDSLYTIYLKQISPLLGDNIVVSSDYVIKSNPLVAINRYGQGIKIVWQCKKNNIWKVYQKNYFENQLSDSLIILDSLETDPQISLSTHRLAWIDNNNLFIKEFYPVLSDPMLYDTLGCSNPQLLKSDYLTSTKILYEKQRNDSMQVYLLNYNESATPPETKYKYMHLSSNVLNKSPKFGINGEIAFQTYQDDVWKSVYTATPEMSITTTRNKNCNYNNPILFTYPVPTSSTSNDVTPFFLAFDTDSLAGNNEIFIKTFYFDTYDSLLNISKCEGNDYEARIAYLSTSDSVFISIIWLHFESNKTDIWIAKDIFNPIISTVENERSKDLSFVLYQNYPNPFNPTTTIEYTVEKPGNVKIIIFDMLGREVKIIVNEFKSIGNYKESFSAAKLSSGIYYYQLISKNNIQTKSMLLLK